MEVISGEPSSTPAISIQETEVVAENEEVVITDVPEAEKPTENEVPPQPEAECEVEKAEKSAAEEVAESGAVEENKITESALFKEESNKHEFTAPPLPPAAKEEENKSEEKKEEEPKVEEKYEEKESKLEEKKESCEAPSEVPPRPEPEASVEKNE
ncbi:patellin-3-like [Forsythia ovata]|uniref:Patellin-3-like n=1 Tax=Forsythia ovata TaxID=205694 RepID=A0ABD1RNP2_9LAMI